MSKTQAENSSKSVMVRIFFITSGIISGIAISCLYPGLNYYFFTLDNKSATAVFGMVFFVLVCGFIIHGIAGVVAGLFVKKKGDIFIILLPNVVFTFGSNLAIMFYVTIQWGWTKDWYTLWSWLVYILWIIFIIFITIAIVFGGGLTGGFRLSVLKRKVVYGVPEKSVFCIRCGTKLDSTVKFCTFCGEELHDRIQQQGATSQGT